MIEIDEVFHDEASLSSVSARKGRCIDAARKERGAPPLLGRDSWRAAALDCGGREIGRGPIGPAIGDRTTSHRSPFHRRTAKVGNAPLGNAGRVFLASVRTVQAT